MAKRISPSQFRQLVNKVNRENKRAVDNYNREVKKHNSAVKKNIANYNREVRKFNAEQERKRLKLNQAIRSFNSSRTTQTIVYRQSVVRLERSYQVLEDFNQRNSDIGESGSKFFEDYPTQETKNSIELYNSISGIDEGEYIDPDNLQQTYLGNKLNQLSSDLGKRWKGALFSLNPINPDACRHFCTSVREVFIQILDIKAPDTAVLNLYPDCELYKGRPTRRFKVKYLLSQKTIEAEELENFVEDDIDDILNLFRTLNDGTHGSAGKMTIQQLVKLKKRVEDSIDFISEL